MYAVLLAATQLQRQCNDAPKLDLRAKRKQIGALLDELTRDAKLAFIKERSNREELLAEIVHSLVSWINDIWTVVYEHHTSFSLAHNCLLYIAEALVQLSGNSSLGGFVIFQIFQTNLIILVQMQMRRHEPSNSSRTY